MTLVKSATAISDSPHSLSPRASLHTRIKNKSLRMTVVCFDGPVCGPAADSVEPCETSDRPTMRAEAAGTGVKCEGCSK